ncbi:flavanone 3-dioxygenase 2-like [Andrographis paniculata]|uniref:flavanone 3-dioxygenase 2-like n=1 Tax=Andrographis paniculata TaxID=175694 RepID=UPI0021E84689|nr:flavanone 3-dioxygenase 2-like [Andrographis paniculata]
MQAKVLSGNQFSKLPSSYIRRESDRPRLSQVSDSNNIPLVDLSNPHKTQIVEQIGHACREYGFFQVVNHGVSRKLVDQVLNVAHEFFNLPVEEKLKLYSDDPSKTVRLSTSFNVNKENVHNWRDYLRIHCYPLDKFVPEWPNAPSSFKDTVGEYCKEVRGLGLRLQEAISESLNLEKDTIINMLGEQGQHMAMNYYPACPEPDLTYGLPAHTDPNALTILLQDQQVSGLQVKLKDGKWLAIKPHPDAFVVNIGDQIQALSNGKYKSVWHRAVVNADRARVSVPTFLCPSENATINAPGAIRGEGEPAIYRGFTYAEYYQKFWSRNLDQEHCLELFKK